MSEWPDCAGGILLDGIPLAEMCKEQRQVAREDKR